MNYIKPIFKVLAVIVAISSTFGDVTEIKLLQNIINMMFIGIVIFSEE